MSLKIGASGVWKGIDKVHVGVGGAWKRVNSAWIGVGGAWKKLYDAVVAQLTNRSPTFGSISPSDARVGYRINADGTVDGSEASTLTWSLDYGTWLTAGTAGQFDVRATLNSGSLTAGTTGTWMSCSSTRTWTVEVTANANTSQTANLTIEIRNGTTLEVLATATAVLTASVELA